MSEHYEMVRKNPFIEEMGMTYRQSLAFLEREAEQEPQWGVKEPPEPEPVPVISERIDMGQLAAEVRGWRQKHAEVLLELDKLKAKMKRKYKSYS